MGTLQGENGRLNQLKVEMVTQLSQLTIQYPQKMELQIAIHFFCMVSGGVCCGDGRLQLGRISIDTILNRGPGQT